MKVQVGQKTELYAMTNLTRYCDMHTNNWGWVIYRCIGKHRFNPIIVESIFLLEVLTKYQVFRCMAMSTMFLEASGILMYGNVSRSFKDISHTNPLAWSRKEELSPHSSCATIPLAHRERMIIISSFVFHAKLRWKAIGKFIFLFYTNLN